MLCSSKRTGCVSSEACGGPSNVVLFPIRLRAVRDDDALPVGAAAVALIEEIEPSFRDVVLAGDVGGYALPPCDLSERVREETARYMVEQVLPLAPGERRRALRGGRVRLPLRLIGRVGRAATGWSGGSVRRRRWLGRQVVC